MADLITTEAFDLSVASAEVAGDLALAVVALIKTNLALDRNTLLADVVAAKANYVGNAEGVLTWLDPSRADDGSIEVVATMPEFRPTNDVTPNDIFGCAVLGAADAALYMVASFPDGPLPMHSALDSILLTLRYKPAGGSLMAVVS